MLNRPIGSFLAAANASPVARKSLPLTTFLVHSLLLVRYSSFSASSMRMFMEPHFSRDAGTARMESAIIFSTGCGHADGTAAPMASGILLQPDFGQINVALDAAQNLVVDDLAVAELDDGVAFRLERLMREPFVFGGKAAQ